MKRVAVVVTALLAAGSCSLFLPAVDASGEGEGEFAGEGEGEFAGEGEGEGEFVGEGEGEGCIDVCDDGRVCVDGSCVGGVVVGASVVDECDADVDCSAGAVCRDHACRFEGDAKGEGEGEGCVSDDDCGGHPCEAGVCVAGTPAIDVVTPPETGPGCDVPPCVAATGEGEGDVDACDGDVCP